MDEWTLDELEHPPMLGMYVRIPIDTYEPSGEFRDYRIGRITGIDSQAREITVLLLNCAPGDPPSLESLVVPLGRAERCRIIPETEFQQVQSGRTGKVLIHASDHFVPGELLEYFVELNGQTQLISEANMIVLAHRQAPHPMQQMAHYEFHAPIWRERRDAAIGSYAELRNATFGVEDLVGSRIMLLAHQAEVIANALSDHECRFILADEVGLGKTIEACVIIKGLRRRNPDLRTLIVVPHALLRQWYNELNNKFWLEFSTLDELGQLTNTARSPGVLISYEQVARDERLWTWLLTHQWGLLIADEAHHLLRHPIYDRIRLISSDAQRALILTATPIQRRAAEFLGLLRLMNPSRYDRIDEQAFARMLASQDVIRPTVAYLSQTLNPRDFDVAEFRTALQDLAATLGHDGTFTKLVDRLQHANRPPEQFTAAQECLAYVSENYRVEARVVRNRRANLNLELPKRVVTESYQYVPGPEEREVLFDLHVYVDRHLAVEPDNPVTLELCRVLLHAAASSPQALEGLLQQRLNRLKLGNVGVEPDDAVLSIASPRLEPDRIRRLLILAPALPDESKAVTDLLRTVGRWRTATTQALKTLSRNALPACEPYRPVQALRAIYQLMVQNQGGKTLVFSTWLPTLLELRDLLRSRYGADQIAEFHSNIDDESLQEQADRFQRDERCRVLLCDELGGEGRNFQIAQQIVHLDLPWTPAQVEQRIGRVDRLGRTGTVLSIVPYATDTLEADLYRLWQEAFQLFTHSMSGMEIALEDIQSELLSSLRQSSRYGLAGILPSMGKRAEELRVQVEEERYFEKGSSISRPLQQEFARVSERYRDGRLLSRTFLSWADVVGLDPSYSQDTESIVFDPRRFNPASMTNAKIFTFPNMEEAAKRSRRSRDMKIRGTFNRDVAVCREDLVFFAPGSDPWTDALIASALECDRGRSCAVSRVVPGLAEEWRGFDLFYTVGIDPRPLYSAGYGRAQLFRAQGFLTVATHRLLVSIDGHVEAQGGIIWNHITRDQPKNHDKHLGQRGGSRPIERFRAEYSPQGWRQILERVWGAAEAALQEEFSFTCDLAEEAREEFERRVAGWRAGQQ
jgi:superfamily II DNA or RNA helicase